MINSKELLHKFSRLIGTPESEGRLSLEILAKLISQKLEFGDVVEIESLGYFAYKKVKPIHSESDEYQKIILFSEEIISAQNKNFLLFFLPDESRIEFPHIDSYLNLSFGKPLITSERIAQTDFMLSVSNNEMIGLIESKVEKIFVDGKILKSVDKSEQEFIIPSTEEIIFDTGIQNELVNADDKPEIELEQDTQIISEEKKSISTFEDFELVEADKIESIDESSSDNKEKPKWVFDDLTNPNDSEWNNQKDAATILDGYSEVKNPFSKKATISDTDNKKDDLGKSSVGSLGLKPKKNATKKLVPAFIGLIIISASIIGVYLNYDKIKDVVFNDKNNPSQNVETQKRIEPVIIARTFEIPVTYPYKKEEAKFGGIPDSLIITSSVFSTKQNQDMQSLSKEELAVSGSNERSDKLIRVQGNIFQRGSEFVVQISSWKSKSKAESEVKKFTELGFPTQLIVYSSIELGKYHKVMVGSFQSLEDAKYFLNQNK